MARTARKKSLKNSVPTKALSKAYESELSYETKVIITVLLLLFVYPIGLIFMWFWMGDWPLWLKIVISLPLFLGALLFFGFIIFIGSIIAHMRVQNNMQNMQQRIHEQQEIRVSLSPTQNTY